MSRKPANPSLATLENAQHLADSVLGAPSHCVPHKVEFYSKAEIALALRMLGVLDASDRATRPGLIVRLQQQVAWIEQETAPGLELRVRDAQGETWTEVFDEESDRTWAAMNHQRAGRTTLGIGGREANVAEMAAVSGLFGQNWS
jgi:hypothetical protein